MKNSINLVTKPETVSEPKYGRGAIIAFSIVLVCALVLIGINFVLNNTLESLSVNEIQLEKKLSNLHNERAEYLVVQNQIGSVTSVLSGRQYINDRLNSLLHALPPDLTFGDVEADGTTVTLSMTSTNLSTLNGVINTTLPSFAKAQKNAIKSIDLNDFSTGGSGGQYTATVLVTYR